ncbi:PorP/SprF family type IX secretion system membrane protein [Cellulophaga lytica]|uniref:Putative membrane protein n=1 Tax=Cellulophaga lytica (strain ATCC 23178 / DSM 7489 / JCM 8516 / NBRC 14961 / NCIMB 1423 / VKM B-1433 / Cy l20) TaxID=867900 RepID=F0RHI6_CELLC|nr:type IX secretion system membrane protein PorP/SprF [Cellulophaga lytica]ADY30252.1 putative membrane protein [Cellulophaga lytica DSM 7489]AIM61244.1 membrane protein [Cellulophaga lytica]WQG78813.1 type IX secretion system membrane protein PorP/SprF [Cellulophaga lytica]
MISIYKHKKHVCSLIGVLLLTIGAIAQQDAQYTQYMYNTISINPAYAGSRGALSIAALHRSQWVGLDGAPVTQTFNIHAPVSAKSGLGISVINDEIGNGTNQDTYIDALYSYTIKASEKGKVSFGLKAGGHFLNIDHNKLRANNPTVVTPDNGVDKQFSPNFGAGIYYHEDKFYAGLSIPNFLETKHFDESSTSTSYIAEEQVNWYLITGYVFNLNSDLKMKPATLLKTTYGAPLQVDVSTTFLYKDKFSMGVAYRWDAALSALIGIQATQRLMVGLAYDKETTALGGTTFNDGSFEVFLRYDFKSKFRNALTPRFF